MKEILKELCIKKLIRLGHGNDKIWKDRLLLEIKEVIGKNEVSYFLKIHEECIAKKIRYENEHNSIIPYLLGICYEFDIYQKPVFDYGEFPDIDIDYIDGVREYVKEVYAKEKFGEDYVCNICNYNTFGIKSALKDMARVFGLPLEEVEAVTRELRDKDDEGNLMTWDEAMKTFGELKAYCKNHPEVADATYKILNRIRSLGQHASGLIISNVKIRDYVPLVRGKDGAPASAWIEGLHGTDLSTVGFIKFDFLGLDGNSKIASACKMACQDKKLKETTELINDMVGNRTVCALPGQPSWSDTSYLNDKKCMQMAKNGDLRMIFQFDGSDGIRNLARDMQADTFEDLVATTSLFRPGPMKLKYHERYINRKLGKEEYTVHPLLADGDANLGFTYNVLVYQEQVSRLLNTVGKVPWADCDVVRKAISKKQIDKFIKYKEAFIEGGQETLGETREYLEHLFEQVEAFAGYGFNLGHAVGYTYISSRMLWLKAHLPKRFFASMFTHTKASGPKDYAKLKEYKREAQRNNVKMARLDINKSKQFFVVNPDDDIIYYGFNKIKGIGDEVAKRLEELQPYANFEDFLNRFGTNADSVKAVIALRCFKEHDPITLYKFYEFYKKFLSSETSRLKRYNRSQQELKEQLSKAHTEKHKAAFITKLQKSNARKEKNERFIVCPTLETFNPDTVTGLKLNEEFLEILKDHEKSEIEFYGYVWEHPLEVISGIEGLTFSEFTNSGKTSGFVEVVVKEVTEKQGPKTTYWSVHIEDAAGWQKKLPVWDDDYERFKDKLQVGNACKIWIDVPEKYRGYNLHAFPRWKKPPITQDKRVVVLR